MNNFYCAAPWRGLHINPRGDVKTCCAGNPNLLGNLNQHSIIEILNGQQMKEIRSSLSQGQSHEYCSNCVRAERFGADSERQWHNKVNPDINFDTAGDLYHYPVIVDVRWNTTCNLSCNYCGESCSSKWATIKGISVKSGARPYYDQVCDFIEQHRAHIHEVALVGGEPLLLPENERLLDVIPADAIVTLITNLSIDLDKNKIFKKLALRKRVGWSMSFDNIGQRFEYVRHGADWELLKHNLSIIKELMLEQGHWGGIHAVYNLYNATRVCELREFAEANQVSVLWQNLFQPEYLDPFVHGQAVAELAAAEIERFYTLGIATDAELSFFNQALTNYRSRHTAEPDITQQFCRHIDQIESLYHKDSVGKFVQLWPELAFLLNQGTQ
jgi:radical SAM protein with 4Fe4S-binding SPASM domain